MFEEVLAAFVLTALQTEAEQATEQLLKRATTLASLVEFAPQILVLAVEGVVHQEFGVSLDDGHRRVEFAERFAVERAV